MEGTFDFTKQEEEEIQTLRKQLREEVAPSFLDGDEEKMQHYIQLLTESEHFHRDVFGLNPVVLAFQTAKLIVEETGLKRDAILAVLLNPCVECEIITLEETKKEFGTAVFRILHGLQRIKELYQKKPVVETENFRNLLLSFAEDMRVILIMIADRVNLMRQIRDVENTELQHKVSLEAIYLYAPLAHKLKCSTS